MDQTRVKKSHLFSAILLVSGCCIGAGMIGFPVVNAMAGFIPSSLAMILCYLFATGTGLLLLEATLWFDKKVNLLSLVQFALGRFAKALTWCLFLFLFYCLFIAYIDGGGTLIAYAISALFQREISPILGAIFCVLFVGISALMGAKAVAGFNRLLMLGLMLSYCGMISVALAYVVPSHLLHVNWKATLATLPILLVSFGYQNLVPTLVYYVQKNVRAVRTAILLGNLIPFLVYFLWNFTILGILPEQDPQLLAKIVSQSAMVTGLLEKASESSSILLLVNTFSCFAILTPFMANTLAFGDFLKDAFRISHTSKYDLLIYALILVPPTVLTLLYPRLFLKALSLAGGFADVLLFGVIPVCVIWVGRYIKKINAPYRVSGGKLFLILILLISISILIVR